MRNNCILNPPPPTQVSTKSISTNTARNQIPLPRRQIIFTQNQIRDTIKNLDNKILGPNCILNYTLTKFHPTTTLWYTQPNNATVPHFLTPWKTAKIKLIPKFNKITKNPACYRLTSLLNLITKILEQLILFQISHHLLTCWAQISLDCDPVIQLHSRAILRQHRSI